MVQSDEWNKIFEGMSDDEVLDWVTTRIEQAGWAGCLDGLNDPEKDVERVAWLHAVFSNGGLPYFFECDHYGRDTVGSLRRLGLQELAGFLDQAYTYAPPPPGCPHTIDLDRLLETEDPIFTGLDEATWEYFKAIKPAIAGFIRRNPEAFAHLRDRIPYNPIAR